MRQAQRYPQPARGRQQIGSEDRADRCGPDDVGELATSPAINSKVYRRITRLVAGGARDADQQTADEDENNVEPQGPHNDDDRTGGSQAISEGQRGTPTLRQRHARQRKRHEGCSENAERLSEARHALAAGHRCCDERTCGDGAGNSDATQDLAAGQNADSAALHARDVHINQGLGHRSRR